MERLHPKTFKVPIDRIRNCYYSDIYFTHYVDILKKADKHPNVLYQFFPRADGVVCGLDEAIAILKYCTGYYKDERIARGLFEKTMKLDKDVQAAAVDMDIDAVLSLTKQKLESRKELNDLWVDKWDDIEVKALYDGDRVKNWETVMTIKGDPTYYGYLETVLLGVIARATSTATAVGKVVKAAGGKPIMFFSARYDHYWTQTTDGYAALKAGAIGVSTDANGDYWGVKSMGTIPHALIAAYNGDTAAATLSFDEYEDEGVNRIALVDWDNDVVGTTVKTVKAQYEKTVGKPFTVGQTDPSPVIGSGKGKLWGVRFDTAGYLRDKSVTPRDESSFGVCPELVWTARKEFDKLGMKNLKIVVTGGFDEKKIELFEKLAVPVDLYGVGSKLLKSKIDITADIVEVNGKPCAKVGRKKSDHSRLSRVEKKYWKD